MHVQVVDTFVTQMDNVQDTGLFLISAAVMSIGMAFAFYSADVFVVIIGIATIIGGLCLAVSSTAKLTYRMLD